MPAPLYYGDYLRLDKLLDCQHPETGREGEPAHDEMLFIIVHQAYELWFKQVLWELDAVLRLFSAPVVAECDVGRATAHLERIVAIQRLLVEQIAVLETMTPMDFLDFRDHLFPASGFQSLQFRLVETKLGLANRVQLEGTSFTSRLDEADRRRAEEAMAQPSLFHLVEGWLERTPFVHLGDYDFWEEYSRAVGTMLAVERAAVEDNPTLGEVERSAKLGGLLITERRFADLLAPTGLNLTRRLSHRALRAALLILLYRDQPILRMPFRFLELLMDVDEGFTTWRQRHALMVQRMIGTKVGTGGSSGHRYLSRAATEHRVFGDLVDLATLMVPRSALPALPDAVRQSMGFIFQGDE